MLSLAHIMAIKQQWKNLVESLDADALIDTLYSKCPQMSLDQMEAITSLQTRLEKAKKLLYFLQSQGADVYAIFLRELRERQSFLYDLLVQSPVSAPHVSPDRPVGYDPVYQPFDRSAIASAATSGIASGGYQLSRDQMIAKLGRVEINKILKCRLAMFLLINKGLVKRCLKKIVLIYWIKYLIVWATAGKEWDAVLA